MSSGEPDSQSNARPGGYALDKTIANSDTYTTNVTKYNTDTADWGGVIVVFKLAPIVATDSNPISYYGHGLN